MIHPAAELRFINQDVGYGVYAGAFIPQGTLIWVLDEFDRVMDEAEVRALPAMLREQVEKYAYVDSRGQFVLCWDFGRYMNHSCDPTSRSVGEAFEIAVRDIHPGEQLTCEYGVLNMSTHLTCACGSPGCRGTIGGDDLERCWERWDHEATEAFRAALKVEQPLLPFAKLSSEDRDLADALRERRMVSIPSSRLYRAGARVNQAEGSHALWAIAQNP